VSPADKIFDPVADSHDEDTLYQALRSPRADFGMGLTFGHQVANDAKTVFGMTEKLKNQGFLVELAGESGLSHDFIDLKIAFDFVLFFCRERPWMPFLCPGFGLTSTWR
jgi:hypothetical protein